MSGRGVVVGTSMNLEEIIEYAPVEGRTKIVLHSPPFRCAAGSSVNVAMAFKVLGQDAVPVSLFGTLGRDHVGQMLQSFLGERFTFSPLPVRTGTAESKVVINRETGEQCIIGYKMPYIAEGFSQCGEPPYRLGEWLQGIARRIEQVMPRLVVVTGVQPFKEEMAIARTMLESDRDRQGRLNVLMPSAQLLEHDGQFAALAELTDIAILNDDEFVTQYGDIPNERNISLLHDFGPKLVLVTCNSRGITYSDHRDGGSPKVGHVPAYPVPEEKIRDRTGAGDSFAGAFLYRHILEGRAIIPSLEFAAATAALVIQRLGGSSIPTLAEVETALAEK